MPNRSIFFIQATCWVFSAIFAAMFVFQVEEEIPNQATGIISVRTVDQSMTAPDAREAISQYATEHEITVGQIVDDFQGDTITRDIYLISADPEVEGDSWLAGDYQEFNQSVATTFKPYDESVTLPVTASLFVVFGEPEKIQQLRTGMTSMGMDFTTIEVWSPSTLAKGLEGQALTETGWMMMLVIIAVLGASVLSGVRTYGIMRLQGKGFWGIYRDALRTVARAWSISGAAVLLIAIGTLYLHNGLAGGAMFFTAALALEIGLVLVCLIVHALALAMAMRAEILGSIKGEMRGYIVSGSVHALRLSAAISLVTMMSVVVAGLADIRQRDDAAAAYAAASDWQGLSLATLEEGAEVAVGGWLRERDQNGDVLLARKGTLESTDVTLNLHPTLTVNDQFLNEQVVVDTSGTEVTPESLGGRPSILIPDILWDRRSEFVDSVASPIRDSEDIAVVQIASGQSVFTYEDWDVVLNAGPLLQDQSYVTDPVLTYAPSDMGLLSDGNYSAYATRGLFVKSAVVEEAMLTDSRVRMYVQAATPVDAQFAQELAVVTRDWRTTVVGVIAGGVVLVVTAIGATLVFCRRGAQRIFARHITGWRLTSTYRSLLYLEAGVLVIALGWIPYQYWQNNRDIAASGAMGRPAMWAEQHMGTGEWTGMVLLGVISTGALIVTLLAIHRRIIKAGASEG